MILQSEGDSSVPPNQSLDAVLSRTLETIVGRAGILALSFLSAIAVARVLSPAERGNFALLQVISGTGAILVNFAVSRALIYQLGHKRMNPPTAAGLGIGLGLASGIVCWLSLNPILFFLREQLAPDVPFALVSGAIALAMPVLLREYVGGVLTATHRPRAIVAANASQPAGLLIVLGIAVGLGMPGDLGSVFLGWAFGLIVSGLIPIASVVKTPGVQFKSALLHAHSVIRFGIKVYPAYLGRFLNLRLDQFLVQLLASSRELGFYAVAVTVAELLIQIPVAMLWALAGTISAARGREGAELLGRFSRWATILAIAMVVPLALMTPALLPAVFGPDYAPAIIPTVALLPGMVCYAPAVIISEYFIVQRGLPRIAAAIAGASLLSSTVLNFVLTPPLGALGASLASTLSYAVMLVTAALYFRSYADQTIRTALVPTKGDIQDIRNAIARMSRFRKPHP